MAAGYHALRRLSRAGAAPVWAARDPAGQLVALKHLPLADRAHPDLVYRFEAEGRLLRELGGRRHLLRCYRTMMEPEPVLVLELAAGGSVRDRLERGPLPIRQALDLVRQTADALEWLHENGVFHRDVKPSNLLIMGDGTLRLADLGVAAWGAPPRGLPEGWVEDDIGTLGYAAPELLRNPGLATRTIDVYALGITLYELVTGVIPWNLEAGETDAALRERLAPGPPPVLPVDLAEPLRSVVLRAIAPDPAIRYSSAAELAAAAARLG